MKKQTRPLTLGLLLFMGGCAQIIGLSDYEVGGKLDASGGETNAGGEANGGQGNGTSAGGGTSNEAGTLNGEAGTTDLGGESSGGQGSAGTSATSGGAGGDSNPGGAGNEGGAPFVPVCTTSKCCKDRGGVAVGTELLKNGNFEAGRAAWGTSTTSGAEVFTQATADTIDAHGGSWFAWLGGETNDVSVLISPVFVIPAQTGWLVASGYHWLKFDSLNALGDAAYLELYDADGDFSNPEESLLGWTTSAADTSDWKLFTKEFPIKTYVSGRHQLSVTSTTDENADDPSAQAATNFFFDDLSLKAFVCNL